MKFALALALIGSLAPDAPLVDGNGTRTTLSDVTKGGPVVIAYANACGENKPRLPGGIPAVVVTPKPCEGTLHDVSGDIAKLLDGGGAMLVDSGRVVRRVAKDPDVLTRDAADWKLGGEIYSTQCLRCHGAEGTDTHYPGIKALQGIGRRISEAEIIERTVRSGSVDLTRFDSAERRALAIYVAGL